jgi:uncharacterized protein YjeT (DUF2065 family)
VLTVSFWQLLGLGVGLALVIEGLMPFFSPAKWRSVFGQIQQMNDGQLRFFGLISIGIGLTLVLVLIG